MLVKEKLIKLKPGFRLINDDESAYILLTLIRDKDYQLKPYVTSFGAASKLLEVFNDYRYNSNSAFTNLIDADYPTLLNDYKKELESNKLIDYIFVLELLKDQKLKEECFVLDDLTLRPLEKEVLTSVFDELEFLEDASKSYGVSEIFNCYGQYNEVANVLEYVQENKVPIGDVEVLYSDSIYENIIKGLCSARNVPYTLKKNHAKSSNYVSFLYDILNYFKNDYKFELLENILSNRALDKIYLNEFYSTLDFPIYVVGFSKDRSKEFIKEYENDEIKKSNIPNFLEFFNDVLSITDNGFDYSILLSVAKKYVKAIDEINILSSAVSNFESLVNLEKDDNRKIGLLLNLFDRLTYNEGDSDQKLSFSPISKSFSLRKYIFVLGVNQTLLVGSDVENAFIENVDKFKEELNSDTKIHVSDYQRMNKVDNLKYYLSHSNATIILSYSSFDKIELKDMTDGVRLITDKTDITPRNCYREQKGQVAFKHNLTINEEEPSPQYNNGEVNPLEEGSEVENELALMIPMVEEPQPYFKLSPSAVGNLIKCPFLFYYQNLLKVPTVEFPELDEASWLEANTRGTMFHDIMEIYFKNFINQEKVEFNQNLFDESFKKGVKNAEKINPVSNTYIHDREKEELKELSETYIKSILDTFDKYKILAVEYNLTKLDYHYSKNETLVLNGKIDRVDGYVDENRVLHLRVVDYKSGKEKKKGEHTYYQHVLYSYVLEKGLTKLLTDGSCEFKLNYTSVVVDEFDYVFIKADEPLRYYPFEFGEGSEDSNKVFNAIDEIVLKYLDTEKDFIELLDDVFNKTYSSFKERAKDPHDMCSYCSYQKECMKNLEWGVKEWQKAK